MLPPTQHIFVLPDEAQTPGLTFFAWGPEPVLQWWFITREDPLLTNYSETERGCEEKHVSPYRSEAGLIQA